MKLVIVFIMFVCCTQCTENRPRSAKDTKGPPDSAATPAMNLKTTGVAIPEPLVSQKAFVDPETGEFTTPPESGVPTADPLPTLSPSAVSESTDETEEQASPVPDGGIMIDLKGRFRKPINATIEDSGTARIEPPSGSTTE